MEIHLDLEKHCIETEMKRLHNAAISHYFKERGEKQVIESQLVLLEKALDAFDFSFLRGRWPVLAGGSMSQVCLTLDDSGTPCLQFENHCITPSEKK